MACTKARIVTKCYNIKLLIYTSIHLLAHTLARALQVCSLTHFLTSFIESFLRGLTLRTEYRFDRL